MSRPKIQQFDYEVDPAVKFDDDDWRARQAMVSIEGHEAQIVALIGELAQAERITTKVYHRVMRSYARQGVPWLSKSQLQNAYKQLCDAGLMTFDPLVRTALQVKPVRSQAGVTVVTVLTKPYPCPGKCIFCPTDVRMPKSYLHDEPGAQRAERYAFDPYDQTAGRIAALQKIGHPVEKIELLILGGTWSSYPKDYQEWFVKRCFDAMNQSEAPDLTTAQKINETGAHRNVGLVVETRQDHIDIEELRWLRYLGVTKVQVGIQSMDERVLALNQRGHDAQSTRDAFELLRLAGFKIHGHWMPNLLGATPESDIADYHRLWDDPHVRPDELKIYPCMLLENSELYGVWQQGNYRPYTEAEVIDVLVEAMAATPRYARLTRVIRDIPTNNVVEGFKKANLRQIAAQELTRRGGRCRDIRAREIRRQVIPRDALMLREERYETGSSEEIFISFETPADHPLGERIAGFLRLSMPKQADPHILPELNGCAMIREVHVYGPALAVGRQSRGEAQHSGLGRELIEQAKLLAAGQGYKKLAVISAIGTRRYYASHGFVETGDPGHYMVFPLS